MIPGDLGLELVASAADSRHAIPLAADGVLKERDWNEQDRRHDAYAKRYSEPGWRMLLNGTNRTHAIAVGVAESGRWISWVADSDAVDMDVEQYDFD